jgi:Something about silencing, SAS, complex subunit 4
LLTLVLDYIKLDEPIYIIDEKSPDGRAKASDPYTQASFKPPSSGPVFERFNINQHVQASQSLSNPLDDSFYLKAHQRAERREKQLRNIEKERAQHEKGQLEQLLDSLLGPDWLRAMGVSGITDGARKEFEPKRDYFIREVRALLDKFRLWREAEKKLLHDRELAYLKEQEDEDDEDDDESDAAAGASRDDEDSIMNGPSSSDVDAWAAHQLQQEAKSFQKSQSRPKYSLQQRTLQKNRLRPPPKPSPPPKPFRSFFAKPHQRALALGIGTGNRPGIRRRTDLVLAFGHPIPAMEEREFELPRDLLSAEALIAHARKRRRLKRERKENGQEKSTA